MCSHMARRDGGVVSAQKFGQSDRQKLSPHGCEYQIHGHSTHQPTGMIPEEKG